MNKLKDVIDAIVKNTFSTMNNLYQKTGKVETLLIFPKYTRGKKAGVIRVSEQELRQLFIEELNNYVNSNGLNLHYSVETPTIDGYKFGGNAPVACKNGRSAMFDLSIWEDDKKVALVEFKSATADDSAYLKDICKLGNKIEGGKEVLRYFINIFEGANQKTVAKINKTLAVAPKPDHTIELRFCSMNNPAVNNDFPTQFPSCNE